MPQFEQQYIIHSGIYYSLCSLQTEEEQLHIYTTHYHTTVLFGKQIHT